MSRNPKKSRKPMRPASFVLLVLIGLGGFNYHRNWQAELASGRARPFERYETADLEKLEVAYRGELAELERRYGAGQRARQRASSEGMLGERLEEFERVQRTSGALRELNTELAEREARLREIDSELARRRSLARGWQLHFARLTRI